jgi:hypothetical protein
MLELIAMIPLSFLFICHPVPFAVLLKKNVPSPQLPNDQNTLLTAISPLNIDGRVLPSVTSSATTSVAKNPFGPLSLVRRVYTVVEFTVTGKTAQSWSDAEEFAGLKKVAPLVLLAVYSHVPTKHCPLELPSRHI